MSQVLALGKDDRVMVVAPHPDDDSLAAGGLLQRALAAGAAVRVLFATDGENNPWTQRLVERRLRIGAPERERFGRRRRAEALAELERLGVPMADAAFLGYPDQGIGDLAASGGEEAIAPLREAFDAWRPTLLVLPSLFDLHPDHSALNILARCAVARLAPGRAPSRVLGYLVHTRGPLPSGPARLRLDLSDAEWERKRAAIACHGTQLAVHRGDFLSPQRRVETFYLEGGPACGSERHPVRLACVEEGDLRLEVVLRPRLGACGRATLRLAADGPAGRGGTLAVDLAWKRGTAPIRRASDGAVAGQARLLGRRRGGAVIVPRAALPPAERLYVKVERRFGFFDEAGWLQIGGPAAAAVAPAPESLSGRPAICCVVPCYNVADLCGPVVKEAAAHAQRVIAVDDGSTDDTGEVLAAVAAESGGRVRVLGLRPNQGKGMALMAAFRAALREGPCDVVVTLDGDGQHRPADIPRLVAACRDGADLTIGERALFCTMPLRSRIGNTLTGSFLRRVYPGCPADTQSGFRAIDRPFLEQIVRSVEGSRYEMELSVLLLALSQGRRIATVPIPTLYFHGNRSSHFRPLRDSLRIAATVVRWLRRGPPAGGDAGLPGAPPPDEIAGTLADLLPTAPRADTASSARKPT